MTARARVTNVTVTVSPTCTALGATEATARVSSPLLGGVVVGAVGEGEADIVAEGVADGFSAPPPQAATLARSSDRSAILYSVSLIDWPPVVAILHRQTIWVSATCPHRSTHSAPVADKRAVTSTDVDPSAESVESKAAAAEALLSGGEVTVRGVGLGPRCWL
jgi:hypothetical protein